MNAKLLSRTGNEIRYEATFWHAPELVGGKGSYRKRVCADRIVPRMRGRKVIGHRLLNTARSCSFYPALEKALGIKWGAA